ncbi:MAG: thiamine phosphate synthase [Phascolarctobacterium sp.]
MFEEGQGSSCLQSFYGQGNCVQATIPKNFQLIAVTDAASCPRSLVEQVERIALCPYKPHQLLLRAKDLPPESYAQLAKEVLPLCQKYGIQLIIHTHWQIALELGVKHVHLPLLNLAQTPSEARRSLVISSSIHSVAEAQRALVEGVQALIAGHIYTTNCKAGVPPRGLTFLQQVHEMAVKHTTPTTLKPNEAAHAQDGIIGSKALPAHAQDSIIGQKSLSLYAIGGIGFDPRQWQELANNGAQGACIMSAYMKI